MSFFILSLMFYVLFLEPDRSTVWFVRKFSDMMSVRRYLEIYDRLGSVNYLVASSNLQIIHFKSF